MSNINLSSGQDELKTDEELAELIIAGRTDLFAVLYRRLYTRTYGLAFRMTGSHDGAEDLTQEIFIRAYNKMLSFRGESSFSTWFYRLALNHSINYCKARLKSDPHGYAGKREGDVEEMRMLPESLAGKEGPPEKQFLQREIQEQIQRALFSLNPRMRMIVILKDVEGLSYEEIAKQLNCSTGTLGSQLVRARRLLARKLQHLRGTL